MLRLRKILLFDYLYYTIFFVVIVISLIRLNLPKKSNYNIESKTITGIVTNKTCKDEKLTLEIKDKNKEKIQVTYYTKVSLDVNLGDTIKARGTFTEPLPNTTKYLFNYKKYLNRKNIFFIVKADSIQRLKENKNIYYAMKNMITNYLNNNPYLNIFLLGDKSYIKEEITNSFQENGISHLFAISGMHITLLSSIIEKLIRKKIGEERTFRITSIVLLTYLLLVGLSPSILRGVLFYILFRINNIYYFYVKPVNIFLLIISISLLINPSYIFEVGFQYSYLICLSLIMLSSKLKSNNYVISLLKVSITSCIVSIPITLYNFYQINLLGIIYNLFYVPLVSIVIFPLSLIAGIIIPIRPLFNFLTSILEKSSLFLSKISLGKLLFKRLPIFIYIIYFIIILLYLIKKNNKILCVLFIILIFHYWMPFIDRTTYIEAIDVGQGDSILIHTNNKNILIDTGGVSSFHKNSDGKIFKNTLHPVLKSEGIRKLDYLIISHGDRDHLGEAINLVSNFKVERVIFNCGSYNYLEKELIKVLRKKKVKFYSCVEELNIGGNTLYFLNTKKYDNENDNSNVIYTKMNSYSFLFMGDASIITEKEILNKYSLSGIDVLKVGHHGSRTSSSKEFINSLNPRYSIISVGRENKYGHPNKEALENLEVSKIYRTDFDGSIMFKIKKNKLQIETCPP